jgi:hypothetical protein
VTTVRAIREHFVDDDVSDAISQNAQGPARAQGDAGSVEQHPLPDQIAADKYLASKAATKTRKRGLLFNQFIPPGTIERHGRFFR